MKTHNLKQGSPEWIEFRKNHLPASELPAAAGVSKYKKRDELLFERKTGLVEEVAPATQKLFEDGHRFERLALSIAEDLAGTELFPVTGSLEKLSASFDGLDLMREINYEHKTLNESIRSYKSADDIEEMYKLQMDQQMLVSGAKKTLFLATKWDANDKLLDSVHFWYHADEKRLSRVPQIWDQFESDLREFEPQPKHVEAVGASPDSLPALRIELRGEVSASNLAQYREKAMEVFAGINTNLSTDQDFADAEKTVKWAKDVESRLELAKESALAQTASIDELFRTIDDIKEQARATRLNLEKSIKNRKESIKSEIVSQAQADLAKFASEAVAALDIRPARPSCDFAGAIKGLKTLDSMKSAVHAALANAKVDFVEVCKDFSAKAQWFKAQKSPIGFPDLATLAQKPMEDFQSAVTLRIRDHEAHQLELKKMAETEALVKSQLQSQVAQAAIPAAQPPATGQAAEKKAVDRKAPTLAELAGVIATHYGVSTQIAEGWMAARINEKDFLNELEGF